MSATVIHRRALPARLAVAAGAAAGAAGLGTARAASVPVAEQLAALTPAATRRAAARLLARVAALDPRVPEQLDQRVRALSAALRGRPFAWNPVGEGAGAFDSDPPLVLDRFDCFTFVETVLALARARDLDEVFDDLATMRYAGAAPHFTRRLHFVSVDWLPGTEAAGLVEDAAWGSFGDAALQALHVQVDRRAWIEHLPGNAMYRRTVRRAGAAGREQLAAWAAAVHPATATLRYVAREPLLRAARGHQMAFAGVMLAAVVRPRTPFAQQAGSSDPVSHCGWLMHDGERWVLRGASLSAGVVTDLALAPLLRGGRGLAPALGAVLLRVRARLAA